MINNEKHPKQKGYIIYTSLVGFELFKRILGVDAALNQTA